MKVFENIDVIIRLNKNIVRQTIKQIDKKDLKVEQFNIVSFHRIRENHNNNNCDSIFIFLIFFYIGIHIKKGQ